MERTKRSAFEALFIDIMDWLEKHDMPVMLQGSTLLNIVRSKTVEPRKYCLQDKEINLYILAEDFTDKMYIDMKRSFPYFKAINNKMPNSAFYFSIDPLGEKENHWDIRGFAYLTRLWQGRTTRFKYQGGESCVLIPNRFVNNGLDEVEILGRKFMTPKNVKKYLTYYYGNWKEEDVDWHWSGSPNYRTWHEMETLKEIP